LVLLHKVGVDRCEKFGAHIRTEPGFWEIYSLTVDLAKLHAILVASKIYKVLVCLHKMAVIDLAELFVIDVLDKEVEHLLVRLLFRNLFSFLFSFLLGA
jgi:hypothetical protein